MKKLTIFIMILFLVGCTQKKAVNVISADDFAFYQDGKEITLFTLQNGNGMVCQLTNFGARIVSIYAPDRNGDFEDVVVGYGLGKDFVEKKENNFGATIGRYGNRIGNALFAIDGEVFHLEKNDGNNHLHGGNNGFNRQVWDVENADKSEIEFSYVSPDMENGYPGQVKVRVKFLLTDANELKIEYFASSDKKTILNLTNHTYFNLKDAGRSTVNDHLMYLKADTYTPVDEGLIPTGELASVAGTPFDFRNLTPIGERINGKCQQLLFGKGYDHNWVLNTANNLSTLAAKAIDPISGRTLEVYTNEPGIQFYSGNFLDGSVSGKNDIRFERRSAFCLETQHFPDSPNKPGFPSVVLDAGKKYYSVCIYKFGVVE